MTFLIVFWTLNPHFTRTENCGEYVIWWYLPNKPSLNKFFWYLVKLWARMALKIWIIPYIMGIRFLAIYIKVGHFLSNPAEICYMVTKEIIIYRLVTEYFIY